MKNQTKTNGPQVSQLTWPLKKKKLCEGLGSILPVKSKGGDLLLKDIVNSLGGLYGGTYYQPTWACEKKWI